MSSLELCIACEAPTGKAGRAEDSLYAIDDGPYCEDCWAELPETYAERILDLTSALYVAQDRIKKAPELSKAETATILAALHYMQSDMIEEGKQWEPGVFATDNFTLEPLGPDDIDALCRRMSVGRKPRRTNFDRATEGLQLCAKMEELTGVDTIASQITDAICQLMHTCRLIRDEGGEIMDFEAALETARANFEAEIDEDPDN